MLLCLVLYAHALLSETQPMFAVHVRTLSYIDHARVFQLLREHLLRNVVQMGTHRFLQTIGIPQGSVMSTLLCDVYFGHMNGM